MEQRLLTQDPYKVQSRRPHSRAVSRQNPDTECEGVEWSVLCRLLPNRAILMSGSGLTPGFVFE
jgi:hypothetical protein